MVDVPSGPIVSVLLLGKTNKYSLPPMATETGKNLEKDPSSKGAGAFEGPLYTVMFDDVPYRVKRPDDSSPCID